jgi:hypothetical protein
MFWKLKLAPNGRNAEGWELVIVTGVLIPLGRRQLVENLSRNTKASGTTDELRDEARQRSTAFSRTAIPPHGENSVTFTGG